MGESKETLSNRGGKPPAFSVAELKIPSGKMGVPGKKITGQKGPPRGEPF